MDKFKGSRAVMSGPAVGHFECNNDCNISN